MRSHGSGAVTNSETTLHCRKPATQSFELGSVYLWIRREHVRPELGVSTGIDLGRSLNRYESRISQHPKLIAEGREQIQYVIDGPSKRLGIDVTRFEDNHGWRVGGKQCLRSG